MTNFDPKIKQISGPVNVVRLEGNLDGIKKVIYLFMDWHENIYKQTECTNIYSKDINKYFVEAFTKINEMPGMYDFFMEVRPSDILIMDDTKKKAKMIYIWQVIKLFRMVFSYDKEKNKVNMSGLFKNTRLHFLDIRDYLKYHIMTPLENALSNSEQFMYNNGIQLDILSNIINSLAETKTQIEKTITALMTNKEKNQKTQLIKEYKGPDEEIILDLGRKIRIAYKHENVRNILVSIFDKDLQNLTNISKNIDGIIQQFKDYGNYIDNNYDKLLIERKGIYTYGIGSNTMRKIIVNITNTCTDLYLDTVSVFARITDVYFLRRFLDKDYITNAIVYSGAAHSETYIRILVSYFGFKVTNASFSAIQNLNELNKEIIARHNKNEEVADLFNPPILQQCSDMTNFPENFL
jgi:hypothetical protein